MSAKQRVVICVPSGEGWKAPMAFQTLCLAIHSAPHVDLTLVNIHGEDTAQGRNRMVRAALAAKADWLFWIDADMIFPPSALMDLLARGKDIVGADYRLRGPPFTRIGLFLDDKDQRRSPPFIPRLEAQALKTGLVEMALLGLGLILVRSTVFLKLPAPWFGRTWLREHATADNPDGFSTEDSYFCGVARHYGYNIWCDLNVSAQVQHIGQAMVPFDLPDTAAASVDAA